MLGGFGKHVAPSQIFLREPCISCKWRFPPWKPSPALLPMWNLLLPKAGVQPGHLPEIPFPFPQDCSPLQRNSRSLYLVWPSWEAREYLDITQEFGGAAALTQSVGNHQKKQQEFWGGRSELLVYAPRSCYTTRIIQWRGCRG